jgi:hypothetical protein|tara:strand:- start:1785 stop:1943 length:159 start_codon:yes stop_codon:yes gene_type:complete
MLEEKMVLPRLGADGSGQGGVGRFLEWRIFTPNENVWYIEGFKKAAGGVQSR